MGILVVFVVIGGYIATACVLHRIQKSWIVTLGGAFVATPFLLSSLIFIGTNESTQASQSSHTASSLKCKNSDKATLSFRKACEAGIALAYMGWNAKTKRWCDCFENNFNVAGLADENCEVKPYQAVDHSNSNDSVKVKCGTPRDPR